MKLLLAVSTVLVVVMVTGGVLGQGGEPPWADEVHADLERGAALRAHQREPAVLAGVVGDRRIPRKRVGIATADTGYRAPFAHQRGVTAGTGAHAGSGRGHRLAKAGILDPQDVRNAGVSGLLDAGLSEGVAENVIEQVADLPAIVIDWGEFPSAVDRGDSEMRDVTIRNEGNGAR